MTGGKFQSTGDSGFNRGEVISGTYNRGNSGESHCSLKKGLVLDVEGDRMYVLCIESYIDNFEYAIFSFKNSKTLFQNWRHNCGEEYETEQSWLLSNYGELKKEEYKSLVGNWKESEYNFRRLQMVKEGTFKPIELKKGMKLIPTDIYGLRWDMGVLKNSITIIKVGQDSSCFESDTHSCEDLSKPNSILSDPVFFKVVSDSHKESCNGKEVEIDGKKYILKEKE